MANKVGSLYFTLGVDATEFEKKLNGASARLADFGKKAQDVGRSMSLYISTPILAAGGAAIKFASDFEESLNKVDVAFGDSADEVRNFAKETLKTYGIAQGTALDMAALFGDMATGMGISQDAAAALSTSMVGLAGDVASFKNMNIQEVTTALNGVFTGETESLKRLGVVMTETNLKQFALEKGITQSLEAMSQGEKVMLRYEYVMAMLANSQGDFERTGGGAANQMRIFTESLKELAVQFGQVMLPAFTRAIKVVNGWVESLRAMDDGQRRMIIGVAAVAAALGPLTIGLGLAASGLSAVITGVKALTIALATNPFGLIAVALAATVAAFATAYAKSEVFRESLSRLFTVYGTIANSIGSILNSIFGPVLRLIGLSSEFGVTWSNMLGLFVGVLNTIQGRLIGLAGVVSGVIRSIDLAFQGEFKKSGHALAQAMQSGLDAVNPGKMAQDFVDAYNSVIGKASIKAPDPTQSFRGSNVYAAMAQGATEATNATKKLTEEQIKLRQEEEKRQAAIKGQLQNVVGLKSLTALTADLTETMGKAPTGFFANLFGDVEGPISNIEAVKQKLIELNNPLIDLMEGYGNLEEFNPLEALFQSIEESDPLAGFQEKIKEALESTKVSAETLMPVFGALGQAISSSLGGAAAGWAQFAASVISGVGILIKAAKVAVEAYKAKAIAAAIAGGAEAGGATGPLAPFTTPAFIATLLGVVGGAIAAIPKFAKGGAVTGPTLAMVGENPASRGEAIIPFERMGSFLSQFTGMGGGGVQQVVVTGQIAGDTIRLSNQKSGINNGRVRWERGKPGRGTALVN
jgi:hypothetical protein